MARVPEADRFMAHVRLDASGCWMWTACCLPRGYGQFRQPTGHELAHRASYRMFRGQIPDGLEVMHSCDTPSCVNPDHLSVGTKTDNMRDARAKGRNARGESHGRAKLTAQSVRAIRASSMPQRDVAAAFGITQGHVSAIQRGHKWSAVADGGVIR